MKPSWAAMAHGEPKGFLSGLPDRIRKEGQRFHSFSLCCKSFEKDFRTPSERLTKIAVCSLGTIWDDPMNVFGMFRSVSDATSARLSV
jgi:hypothetical protein